MIAPKNTHRAPVMDQDYLVAGVYNPQRLPDVLTLDAAIKLRMLDAFVPIGFNCYRVVASRADQPRMVIDEDGSVWKRSEDRDTFIRVAADEPPTPEEKEEREGEDEDDLVAGFDETFGEELDDELPDIREPAPNDEIPGTVDNPTREFNGEEILPPETDSIHMTEIGPARSNDVLLFQTYMPGQTPKPTLKERVTEHAQEGAELRDELCELVEDVQEVIELAQGTGVEEPPADELTVVLNTPTYTNPLVLEQSNDPMSPTFAQYGSQKQAGDGDDEGPEDYPPDSEQAARDAARNAFAETMSTTGDTDRAHDAAYEAAFQALTPFIKDVGKVEQLAQAIMSDMQTNPKTSAVPLQRGPHGEQVVTNPDLLEEGIGKPFKHYRPSRTPAELETDRQMEAEGYGKPGSQTPQKLFPSGEIEGSRRRTAAEGDEDLSEETQAGESDPMVHLDADLNDSEKLNLILRELEEVEEAVGINETPEEEAIEENAASATVEAQLKRGVDKGKSEGQQVALDFNPVMKLLRMGEAARSPEAIAKNMAGSDPRIWAALYQDAETNGDGEFEEMILEAAENSFPGVDLGTFPDFLTSGDEEEAQVRLSEGGEFIWLDPKSSKAYLKIISG